MNMKVMINDVLRNSKLTEELENSDIEILANLCTVREYKAGESILQPGQAALNDAILALVSGDVEATAVTGGERITLHLVKSGEMAGIIGFVGGNGMRINATVFANTESKLIVLERFRLESLLNTHPSIVFSLMRGIARYVHCIMRRFSTQSSEMGTLVFD